MTSSPVLFHLPENPGANSFCENSVFVILKSSIDQITSSWKIRKRACSTKSTPVEVFKKSNGLLLLKAKEGA